ncbi:MAG: hypothetical protein LCH81_05760 [Bacteroidetes bacterium]|nr:hypothetical protein [Bacteroidota bacterium]
MDNQVTPEQPTQNPNEILAQQIFQKLFDAGLITDDGKAEFIKNLGQGKLGDSSWRVALEQIIKSKPASNETPKT